MLPTAHDLDDPDGFVHHEQLDFSELDKMLGEAANGQQKPGTDITDGDSRSEGDGSAGDDSKDDTDK